METLWLPGTLCDARVFGEAPSALPGSARHAELVGHSRVEDAAAAVLAIAAERFIAIGFSLGGFVALELLTRAPERIAGIVLVSGNAHPDAPENAPSRRAEVRCARERGMSAHIDGIWPRLVGLASQTKSSTRELLVAMAEGVGAEAFARQAEMNIARPDFRALVAASATPLLVIAGENDQLCPRERYQTAASGPRSSLTIVPGAGHFLPLEAPGALIEEVGPFMQGIQQ